MKKNSVSRSNPSSVGTHTRVTIRKSIPNYKKDRTYQIWQESYQPKLIQTEGTETEIQYSSQ